MKRQVNALYIVFPHEKDVDQRYPVVVAVGMKYMVTRLIRQYDVITVWL